ncbi:L,D-transpeptidase [Thermithiobacillus plumbiphilus]|uniref:L,D-transpeptidase n=1 Tax=Thermithiobacillus plumbiphilus TaxID=1729899 RepID=A0ABU9D5W6_9PROT
MILLLLMSATALHAETTPQVQTPMVQKVAPVTLPPVEPAKPLPWPDLQVPADAHGKPWILIDTRQQILEIRRDRALLKRFGYVAIGRGGAAPLRRMGDGKTPLGTYHIAWINDDSRFHIFFGLDFPNGADLARAYQNSMINREVYGRNMMRVERGMAPMQNTALGGSIGIHGLGPRDVNLHRRYNWTDGCIALDNEEVEELASWVEIGTTVVIR